MCFGVVSFDSALHRNIVHLFELRIYFHLELLTCTNLFQGIHTLESVLEHLFHKILVQVIDALVECCLVIIRDERHPPLFLLAFIHLPHTSFHACPHYPDSFSLTCYYLLQGRKNLEKPLISADFPSFFY